MLKDFKNSSYIMCNVTAIYNLLYNTEMSQYSNLDYYRKQLWNILQKFY